MRGQMTRSFLGPEKDWDGWMASADSDSGID